VDDKFLQIPFPNLKKHVRGQRFLIHDNLQHETEEWLSNHQNFAIFYRRPNNSEITINCALTKVVIMFKNKRMLIYLSFIQIG